ncbi:hypothetical protein [Vibrio sp. TBV020]|uniref:hypothetical protein n=1 Tax=Vibrio sp. TBV020 TaxID=3137398 RepID=UPI0038CD8A37
MIKRILILTMMTIPIYLIYQAINQTLAYHYFIGTQAQVKQILGSRKPVSNDDARKIDELNNYVTRFDPNNPSYILYLAQLDRWVKHNLGKPVNSEKLYHRLEVSNRIRPLEGKQYLEQGMGLWRDGANFEQVKHYIRLAKKFGQYDPQVSVATFELYIAHWAELSVDDKLSALSFFTESERYGLRPEQFIGALTSTQHRQRACYLFKNYSSSEVNC